MGMRTVQLSAISNMIGSGLYDDLATAFMENGICQIDDITLPYGFVLSIENPMMARQLAWDSYSLGAMTSLLDNCGSLLFSLKRIETGDMRLISCLITFNKDIGFLVFFAPGPDIDRGSMGNIASQLNCGDFGEVIEIGFEALKSQLLSNESISITACQLDEVTRIYQNLVQNGIIKNMYIAKGKNGGWEYPAENYDLAEMRWRNRFERARQCGNAYICQRMMTAREINNG